MAKDSTRQKTQSPAPPSGAEAVTETADAPLFEPPQDSLETQGTSTMTDAMPSQEPPDSVSSTTAGAGAEDVPTLTPDGAQAAVTGGIAAWLNNKRVGALWGINQNRNSWVYITGVGWKKLANNSDSAIVALTTLAASAKLTQTNYNYREESDGMIHETYVW